MRKIRLLASLFTLSAILTSCNKNNVRNPLDDKVLTIGLECAYSPYNYTEYVANENNVAIKGTNGEYCGGYDILIAKRIAQNLGVTLEVVRCDWEGLIPQVSAGTIDAIIAGMTDTEERRNSIDFTDEYYKSTLVIVTNNENANKTTIEDFAGLRFTAQLGTVQADLITELAESKGIVAAPATNTYPEAFVALNAGTVDAVICESPVATDFLNSASGNGYTQVVLEGNDDFVISVSIGIAKDVASTYKDALNEALAAISQATREELMRQATGA